MQPPQRNAKNTGRGSLSFDHKCSSGRSRRPDDHPAGHGLSPGRRRVGPCQAGDGSATGLVFTVPEDQVEARIRLGQLTPKKAQKAQKYRHTLKLLELAGHGLHSAEIAQTLGIPLKEVQQLRRSAMNTLDTVEAKIHA